MKLKQHIPAALTQAVARNQLKLEQNSPHILFGLGVAGVLAGTVLACRATLQTGHMLDEVKRDIESVKKAPQESDDYRRDLAMAYGRGVVQIGRAYFPAVVVTTVSIGLLTKSHSMLSARNATLTAAYTALNESYMDYRERVREEVGEEKEGELYFNLKDDEVEIDGKKVKIKALNPNGLSPYARLFDELSPQWRDDPELNLFYVRTQQNYFNDQLTAKGHVFLNDVYYHLGLPETPAGQVVGWVVGEGRNNHIDFGIYDPGNSRFVNGQETSVLLDFNVDGVVFDCLEKPDE